METRKQAGQSERWLRDLATALEHHHRGVREAAKLTAAALLAQVREMDDPVYIFAEFEPGRVYLENDFSGELPEFAGTPRSLRPTP